jgi:hypothetical protein
MGIRSTWLLLSVVLAVLQACAGNPTMPARSMRKAPTTLESGDAVVVVLNSYKDCGKQSTSECSASTASYFSENELEYCVGTAIRKQLPAVTQVRASAFRQAVAPGKQFRDSPHSPETILAALQDPATRTKLGDLHLRYVMVLDVDATDSPTATHFGVDGRQGILVWGINREWTHSADFSATVVDLREVREAGVITANASGKSSYAIVAVWILPLPPFPTSFSASESRACNALGLALADFVRGKD